MMQSERLRERLEFLRTNWRDDDGGEGETIHAVCREVDRLTLELAFTKRDVEVSHEAMMRNIAIADGVWFTLRRIASHMGMPTTAQPAEVCGEVARRVRKADSYRRRAIAMIHVARHWRNACRVLSTEQDPRDNPDYYD